MQWSDGRFYRGGYLEDKKHGHGCFTWPNGRKYDGQWLFGRQHGTGRISNGTGKARTGEWQEGRRIRWLEFPRHAPQDDVPEEEVSLDPEPLDETAMKGMQPLHGVPYLE